MTKSTKANSTTIATPAAAEKAARVVKAEVARGIFAECVAAETMPRRKDILARFQAEAQLSKPAASTYLQNCKRAAGFIV